MCHECRFDRPTRSRRTVLHGAGAIVAGALAGCLGGGESEPPEPITLSGGKQCDVCGMIVGDHYGPNGQLFYADNSPEGHDNPAIFEGLRSCFFPYYFTHEDYSWTVAASYVTDYSVTDYELSQAEGRTYISTHTEPETFADATALSYVVGSSVHGAMGREFVPFSEDDDATAFAEDHGGSVVAFDEIAPSDLGG